MFALSDLNPYSPIFKPNSFITNDFVALFEYPNKLSNLYDDIECDFDKNINILISNFKTQCKQKELMYEKTLLLHENTIQNMFNNEKTKLEFYFKNRIEQFKKSVNKNINHQYDCFSASCESLFNDFLKEILQTIIETKNKDLNYNFEEKYLECSKICLETQHLHKNIVDRFDNYENILETKINNINRLYLELTKTNENIINEITKNKKIIRKQKKLLKI